MITAIRDVGDTLVNLARSRLSTIPADQIALCSPSDASKNPSVRIGIYLYSIAPTADLRNEFEIPHIVGNNALIALQPLDLYYLVTAYPQTGGGDLSGANLDAHRLLGAVMQAFFDRGTLTGSVLRGDIPRNEEIRLTHQPITVEDVTRIWATFPNVPLQTSVSYLASPVNIQSDRGLGSTRVAARQTDVAQSVPTGARP
jgi:hypothetical protein